MLSWKTTSTPQSHLIGSYVEEQTMLLCHNYQWRVLHRHRSNKKHHECDIVVYKDRIVLFIECKHAVRVRDYKKIQRLWDSERIAEYVATLDLPIDYYGKAISCVHHKERSKQYALAQGLGMISVPLLGPISRNDPHYFGDHTIVYWSSHYIV